MSVPMLRQPLSKPLLLAVLVMLGLSFLLVRNSLLAWNDVQRVVKRSELVAAAGHFVHELQIERGLSAFYLSGREGNILSDLQAQHSATDVKRLVFDGFTSSALASGDSDFAPELSAHADILDKLAEVRESVTTQDIHDDDSFAYYSRVIKQILDLQQELSQNVANRELRDGIRVLQVLSWIKERTGQIRALGSEGFASGHLSSGDYNLLIQLIGIQNDRKTELYTLLSPSQRARIESLSDAQEAAALDQLQGFLLDDGLDGTLRVSNAQPWFNAMTVHINRFKNVEDELTDQIVQTSLTLKREITLKFFSLLGVLIVVLSVTMASLWRGQRLATRLRKDLQESLSVEQQRSQQILETMSDAICVVNHVGVIEYANPAMRDAFGDEDFQRRADEVLPCKGSKGCALTAEGLTWTKGKCSEVISPITGRGYGVHCAPFGNRGEMQSRLVVLTDVTAHLQAEQRLLEAKNAAESANQTKSSLLANMSHELRTPLNAIIGFSDIMVHNVFGALSNERYSECARDIHSSGLHLLDLINDILDVSAIEAGKVELQNEDMEIVTIVEAAVRLIQSRAEKGKVALHVVVDDNLPLLFGDIRRLKQILLNLLSNAVKFTPEHGRVSVRSYLDEQGAIVVCIEDTGVGMDQDELVKAMEPFGQADSSLARKHEGTGLGLPLTKGLVELHGGEMSLASEKGRGTTVKVCFPAERSVARPDETPSPRQHEDQGGGSGPTPGFGA